MALTIEKIEAIAPDQSAVSAARKLLKPGLWPKLASDGSHLVWGECQGSGAAPDRVVIDESNAARAGLLKKRTVPQTSRGSTGSQVNSAPAYCEQQIEHPAMTHLVLITDLYEGGDAVSMLSRAQSLKESGVNLIVLLALSDDGHPGYHASHAESMAALGCPVFACTPDLFQDLMAMALARQDISRWAAGLDIPLIQGATEVRGSTEIRGATE